MLRLSVLVLLASFAGVLTHPAAAQDRWPQKPVRLVVPYPVVVENKGGAGSNVGSDAVAKSQPDGYTILLGSSANVVNMVLYRKMTYDTFRDLVPVTLLADVPNVLVVPASFPAKSVAELVDSAKKRPDGLTYASAGSGSPAHLAAEKFIRMSGLSIRHVPYKGAGPAMVDVIAGRVDMMFTNIAAVQGGIEAGKLRLLATGGSSRWPSFPDVPTIAEAGVPGYEASAWYGLMLPTGTPAAVLERLQRALTKVRSPESMDVIRKLGAEPIVSSPDALRARMDSELKSYSALIKALNLSVE